MMKICVLFVSIVFVAACGGKKPPPEPPAPAPVVEEAPPDAAVEEAPSDPPPTLQTWHAEADLAPVKGAKMKAATVTFSETEGDKAQASASIDGLASGTYHLVVHDAAACGKNATKAGKAWDGAIDLTATKGEATSLDGPIELALDGDQSIVGHTLVLHADKKGKVGKAVACGPIVSTDQAEAGGAEEEDTLP